MLFGRRSQEDCCGGDEGRQGRKEDSSRDIEVQAVAVDSTPGCSGDNKKPIRSLFSSIISREALVESWGEGRF